MAVRPARATDFEIAVELLQQAGLPTADLAHDYLALVFEENDRVQGVIGVEHFDKIALLRSLVVMPDARGGGVGPALIDALETSCALQGVRELWLLTIDADGFFKKLGYECRPRDAAPDSVRQSEEFSSLCPGDAFLMSKSLLAN